MKATHADILKAANTVLGFERCTKGFRKGELRVSTAGEGRPAKKYRSDSRIITSQPKYFTELNMQLYILDEHDLHEIEKLEVGEYYLNEFTRYTRVA